MITAGAVLALVLLFIYRRRIALFLAGGTQFPRNTNPQEGASAAAQAAQAAENAGQPFNPNRPLRRGVDGVEVEFLQTGLNREGGYSLEIDGDFGPLTEAALYDARGVKEITYNQYITGMPGIDSAIEMNPTPILPGSGPSSWTTPPFF